MGEDLLRISTSFGSKFNSSHVLLFLGKSITRDDIKSYIAKERWSAVITTRRDDDLAGFFATDSRKPWECNSLKQLSDRSLSREQPPIIQLFGINGVESDDSDSLLYGPSGQSSKELENAKELLHIIPSLLSYSNYLVIIGIDSDEEHSLLDSFGRMLLQETVPRSASFWGMKDAFSGNPAYKDWFYKISERMSYEFYDTSLIQVIKYRIDEERTAACDVKSPMLGDDVLFCNHNPASISQDDLLRIKSVGTLLTEHTINRIRPLGRIQQRLWFSNFLELSGVGEPQWYGYLPQSSFHVKREYEDTLTLLVRRALRGQNLGDISLENKPIILSGAPGSSKSVTLGALAYRVYNERMSPVLFISGNVFQGGGLTSSYRKLVDSLETIQRVIGTNAPVLVIWDGSAYREIESDARRILLDLKNRGRNVVLLCSSYSLGNDRADAEYYSLDSSAESFTRTDDQDAEIVYRAGCVFVKSTRTMSEREQYHFWQKATNYSGVSAEQISFLKKHMKEDPEPDIFNHYYSLISLLRKRLEDSLEGEQDAVARFLQAELPDYFKSLNEKNDQNIQSNPMWQAFLKAGMSPEDLESFLDTKNSGEIADQETEQDEWNENLIRATSYIALFSRYKIDIPYRIVYSILTDLEGDNPYSEEGRELFDVMTTKIPWLLCGENDDEEYVFRFRNTLEADIFLNRHGIDGPKLVDMVIKVLEMYGEIFKRDQFDDPRLATKLQALIRLLGPNSKYYNGQKRYEHQSILACLDRVIDAIDGLLNLGVPDEDSGFAMLFVTLSREYYGKNVWEQLYGKHKNLADCAQPGYSIENYEERLAKIDKASALALTSEQKLEQIIGLKRNTGQEPYLSRQANALIVESTRCSLETDSLRRQYEECCRLNGKPANKSIMEPARPYIIQFEKLESVIRRDPLNGYAYNAMFALFEREYEKDRYTEADKMQFLTEVMAYVQDCLTLGDQIENRGDHKNELDEHIATIGSLADNIPVSIDSISINSHNEDTAVFAGIYQRFLEEGNPAAILFVCRKEIKDIFSSQESLSKDACLRCRRVLEFMKEPTRFNCVSHDANALATMIRIAWMAYSGKQLSATRECQTTCFNDAQWREFYRYCNAYVQVAPAAAQQPLMVLIYALSTLQIEGKDTKTYERAYQILQQIREEQFGGRYRLRTPFIVCNEDGKATKYTGTVRYAKDRTGFIRVYGLPPRLGSNEGVRCYFPNLGRSTQMPEVGDVLSDLELGIGYTGFYVYKEEGCKERRRSK